MKNAIDKIVFVENDGENDAYVRTWFAFEQGSIDADNYFDIIGINHDVDHWDWVTEGTGADGKDELIVIPNVEITDKNGVTGKYLILVATYKGPSSRPNGILAPGKVSYPSLLQVYMNPKATNEDVKAIDANGNGKFDILVKSQAVQTAGFSDAKTALDEAFGEATAENHPFNK